MRFRSVLFTPGTQPERIQKALEAGTADVVVADLEDAVAPRDKIEARIAVRNALLEVATAPAVRAVRINAWPSAMAEEDLEVVLPARPDLIVVPKAEDAMAIQALDSRIAEAEEEPGQIGLLLIIETARGVLQAQQLAACSDRVRALALGAEDLAADVGMRRTPENSEVAVPRSLVALAAAASGIHAVDMITADYQDEPRFSREASEARGLGYAGKMCIHPAQVPWVHRAVAPTDQEKIWATQVLQASDAAEAGEGGILVVNGQMIDVPLIQQARRIISEAE